MDLSTPQDNDPDVLKEERQRFEGFLSEWLQG
jgi:hypothetical protein